MFELQFCKRIVAVVQNVIVSFQMQLEIFVYSHQLGLQKCWVWEI